MSALEQQLPPSAGRPHAVATRKGRVERALRERDVITLAVQGGYSDAEISALLTEKYAAEGRARLTARQVFNIREKALARYAPDQQQVEKVRAEQLQTLDELRSALMPKAMAGKVREVEAVLKIENMRADLAGTKAPKQLEHHGQIEHVHELVDPDEVQRLEEAFTTSFDAEGTADEVPLALEPGA